MTQSLTKSQSVAAAMLGDGARFTHHTYLSGRGTGVYPNGKATSSVPTKKLLDELVSLNLAKVESAGGQSVYTGAGK